VSSLMLYVGSFAVGLGPVFWLMLSEIYSLRIRGRAMSVGTIVNWSANLLVALTFLSLVHGMGKAATFWLYGVSPLRRGCSPSSRYRKPRGRRSSRSKRSGAQEELIPTHNGISTKQ
jgi:hypothetical protein